MHLPSRALATTLGLGLCAALATATLPAAAGIVDDPVSDSAEDAALSLSPLGTFESGVFDESAAEIVAHHAASQRLFVVNAAQGAVQVLDIADPTQPVLLHTLDTTGVSSADGTTVPAGAVANSVAVRPDGLGIVAVQSDVKTDDGWLVLFDAADDGATLGAVRVGALPDMVTVTPDGRRAVVANEGEPDDDYTVDPEGSVSVVDLPGTVAVPGQDAVRTATFHAFEEGGSATLPDEVRIFAGLEDAERPVSANLEPEYVVVDASSTTAYVVLQENNATAVVDLDAAQVTEIWPLGAKDHSLPGNGMDPSDRDGRIDIRPVPVKGLYMPDGMNAYVADGETYLVTANEGDAREWGDYAEPARVKDLGKGGLAPVCTDSPAAGLRGDADLGRLNVSTASGLAADGSCYEELYAFGARSFSIWTTAGERVFDSGDDFEQITAAVAPEAFNSNHSATNLEGRSDDKGPEPENLAIGEVDGRTYAFIGFERVGGVIVYDITTPDDARYVTYVNNRDLSVSVEDADDQDAALAQAGDLGPEGLAFIPGADSPTGTPLLAVASEVSGTTTLFSVGGPAPTTAPGKPVLSDDSSWDGIRGGSYTITANLWWGQNGTTFRLFEDGELVHTQRLVDATPAAQKIEVPLTGRTNGTYAYTCELVNAAGTTPCRTHTVKVTDANPGVARLSHDNHRGGSDYTVQADMWWGTNATSWVLYEDDVEVAAGELTDRTPAAQQVRVPLEGRERGSYTYRIETTNDAGTTASKDLTVRVR
ncbi:choice-of-anchor I family protein [Oerskovia flava]|uniref:choice-of-anchor I family protein n=1 Tax=Oerskovia flava TaxID=2986422 RepID=UPI00223E98E5|nr:choice-of-anchor I family protein [Oerskovia sp. JB1-3-2]